MLYYEDMQIGKRRSFGSYEVTREEVIDFASKYDPQPFHLSDEAAAQTFFGRLAASGWHSCAMMMRMLADKMEEEEQASLGSPGIDELRWLRPVHPGDTLRCENEVVEKRLSKNRPEMGILKSKLTVFNQDDEPVLTMLSNTFIRVREPKKADG